MTKLIVPRWFIRQIAIRSGMRLPKKPTLINGGKVHSGIEKHYGFMPAPMSAYHSGTNTVNVTYRANSTQPGPQATEFNFDITKRLQIINGDTFDPADYRFWNTSVTRFGIVHKATCRQCGGIVLTEELRRKHQDVLGCYAKLVAAYKLLDPDSLCVICNRYSGKRKWGVPLCSDSCVRQWCFAITRPDALTDALDLVKERQLA